MDHILSSTSAERNFLAMIIPHCQGAVDMATYKIVHCKTGKNSIGQEYNGRATATNSANAVVIINTKTFTGADKHRQQPNGQMMSLMMQQMPIYQSLKNDDNAFARVSRSKSRLFSPVNY